MVQYAKNANIVTLGKNSLFGNVKAVPEAGDWTG
jgi:hypothetical protein